MWLYVIAAIIIFILLKELIRLPTIGKYGERYVFITGCDMGFGNQLAKRLDSLGFNVFAGCFLEKGADELRKVSSSRLKTVPLDVTKIESIQKARDEVEKQLPHNNGIWAIVNNAGVGGPSGVCEWFTRADYESCLAVNLYGVIDVTRVFLPLIRKGHGRVVNIASMMGRIAASTCPYVISKYGVEAFSDCLRREVLNQGVTVHIIEPGLFKTELMNLDVIVRSMNKSFNQTSQEVQKYYGNAYVEEALRRIKYRIENVGSTRTFLVVDAYTHAITAMFPRYRYLVSNDCKYYYRPLWNLPEWVSDRVLMSGAVVPDGAK